MSKLLLDTSAWIEYLNGTERGRRVREHLVKSNEFPLMTGMIAAEICSKFVREQQPVDAVLTTLRTSAMPVPFDLEVAHRAAHVYSEQRRKKQKFGIVDAHIVAAARLNGAKIVTCDTDFLGIPEAIVIK
jgi:predicted nucleic acid-binding protein